MKNSVSPNDLMLFLAVLDEGGFRAAAHRLGIAPSKVSTTVSRIEKQLGVPLLLRTTRSIRATDEGRALADRIGPLLSDLRAACVDTAQAAGRVSGRLKLNVPGAVVPDILPPVVSEFRRRHPAVEVEIIVENGLIDILASDCDAGIRYGSALEKDMVSIPIGPRAQQIALAASPTYLDIRGTPQSLADLTRHEAIRYRLSGGDLLPWSLKDGDETLQIEPTTGLVLGVDAIDSALSYARAGMGIVATFRNWLEADFQRGTLRPVLSENWPSLNGPRLYFPSRFTSPALRAFIETCHETRTER